MKKLALLIAVGVVASVSIAQATNHKMAGCGLGSMIFKDSEKGPQIVAATTNGLFGNQTFGISSETLGCTKDGMVMNHKRQEVYAEVNFRSLQRDMAQGGGEYLTAFASVMGCEDETSQKTFVQFTQKNFATLFPSERTDSTDMLSSLRTEMAKEPVLAKSCTL